MVRNPVALERPQNNHQSRDKNKHAAQQSLSSWNVSVKVPIKERRRNQREVKKWSQISGISNLPVGKRFRELIKHTENA